MRVLAVDDATPEEWDQAFAASHWATAFESRAWAEDWAAVSGDALRPRPKCVRFADGQQVVLPHSAAPLARGWLAQQTMPVGSVGGWLAEAPLTPGHVDALVALLRDDLGDVELRVSPYAPHVARAHADAVDSDETQATALQPGFDAVFKRWSKGHRAAARQAEREGVSVRRARDLPDWRQYYAIYEETHERWGDTAQSHHPWALFERLAAREDGSVTLWLAVADGEPVAGALCLNAAHHVAYWHGAARAAALPRRPVHRLMYVAMRDAAARGAHWFDFNPSGGLEGVARFKRGFGTRALAVPRLRAHSLRARAAATARSWWARGVGGELG